MNRKARNVCLGISILVVVGYLAGLYYALVFGYWRVSINFGIYYTTILLTGFMSILGSLVLFGRFKVYPILQQNIKLKNEIAVLKEKIKGLEKE